VQYRFIWPCACIEPGGFIAGWFTEGINVVSIGLIELPAFKLLDQRGLNWTALRQREPLGSKQVLAAQLNAAGVAAEIINLKNADNEVEFGFVNWKGKKLRKIAVGRSYTELNSSDFDLWGLTVNYSQERELACAVIRYLASAGGRVIVGGSDVFADASPYLRAGAEIAILDKSGSANIPAINWLAGAKSGPPPQGLAFADGAVTRASRPPMSPQDWPLPERSIVNATLGTDYWEAPIPDALKPVGSVMLDIGCDRHCDFCETPTYGLGYRAMSPERSTAWLAAQAEAGAKSVIVLSDQFLGRVLRPDGRAKVIEIMRSARALSLPVLWGNGIELKKATLGRSLPGGDLTPDLELIEAVWGWDGNVGCAQAYIPAERPLAGTAAYPKLLAWEQHCRMMEAIVSAGVPDITYGIIIGLPEDSDAELDRLHDGVSNLKSRLKSLSPELKFRVTPYAIRPIPGTRQASQLQRLGLLKFDDPAITGGFWTACSDTKFLSYAAVSDWQGKLLQLSDPEKNWQGITAFTA
jgi:hypothetical protein